MSPSASPDDQVLTNVPTSEAMRMAEIQAMRQLADAVASQSRQFTVHMDAQTRVLEKMSERLEDVRERVIALEMSGYDERLKSVKADVERLQVSREAEHKLLESRVNSLESQRDMAKGAVSFWEWMGKNVPWLITLAIGAAAALGFKKP